MNMSKKDALERVKSLRGEFQSETDPSKRMRWIPKVERFMDLLDLPQKLRKQFYEAFSNDYIHPSMVSVRLRIHPPSTREEREQDAKLHFQAGILFFLDLVEDFLMEQEEEPKTWQNIRGEGVIRYRNLITDVKHKRIWSDGLEDKGEGFNDVSEVGSLWLILVNNIGKEFKHAELEKHIKEAIGQSDRITTLEIRDVLKNLVDKLMRVSGKDRAVLFDWFNRSKDTLGLKTYIGG